MSDGRSRFASPLEVSTPEGADGWQSMYPFYLVPRAETRTVDDTRFWFADTMHFGHPMYPFDAVVLDAEFLGAGQNSARIFALPRVLGLDVRVVNGYVYLAPIPVTDPSKIDERAAHFRERAGHYYANWPQLYEGWQSKVRASIARMKSLQFPMLDDLDALEVVKEGRGRSTAFDLIASYHQLIDECLLVGQYHFEMLNLGYAAYMTFFEFCKAVFPEISDQTVARMVAGLEVLAFRPDGELRRLAQIAVDLDVDVVLRSSTEAAEILETLGRSEAGRRWLQALDQVRDPWFNYSTAYGYYHDEESWNTDLAVPLTAIARYTNQLRRGAALSRPVDVLREERNQFVQEYRQLLAPNEQAQFDALLSLSTTVFPFIEEHNLFVEHWAHTAFWAKTRELGRVLVDVGYLSDVEDLFYLNRYELDQVLFDAVDAWATGVAGRGVEHWAGIVRKRRRIMAALRAVAPPPALGAAPEEITDPFAIMNYGITTHQIKEWLGTSRDVDDDVVTGIPGSPGVAEGVVRVIRSERELDQVQEGEVLVCPTTAPSWAPAFTVVRAVVSDIGGMMSHAAIVCREYRVPAVVGTGFATSRLRTGQRVQVDGGTGRVRILG